MALKAVEPLYRRLAERQQLIQNKLKQARSGGRRKKGKGSVDPQDQG
jgi:hypothetical protein